MAKHFEVTELEVPFQSASFSLDTIDQDRREISGKLFTDVDILVLPTVTAVTPTLTQAEKKGSQAVAPDNTFFCNYFALPAINIPFGFTASGLPVGLQLVGRSWEDQTVLRAASEIEATIAKPLKKPPLWK